MDLPLKDSHFETACKVCSAHAVQYGAVDFNKNCLEVPDVPMAGIPIQYHRCENCGLVFSHAFDEWSAAEFRQHIYNDDYVKVDPGYLDVRPRRAAKIVSRFIARSSNLHLLDYGGGNGLLASVLRENGIQAKNWDPIANGDTAAPDRRCHDLVTAFEVFEHTAAPKHTAEEALSFLNDTGVLLFSTEMMLEPPAEGINFWYIAPRNGHITIHTPASLEILLAAFGYRVHHYNTNMHMAFRDVPKWLK